MATSADLVEELERLVDRARADYWRAAHEVRLGQRCPTSLRKLGEYWESCEDSLERESARRGS